MEERLATKEDIPVILDLLHSFNTEWGSYKREFSESKVTSILEFLIDSDEGLVALAGNYGVFIATTTPSLFSDNKQTSELIFYIKPEKRNWKTARKLIRIYEYWAKEIVGADYAFMTLINTRVGNLYKKMNYEYKETLYAKYLGD